MSTETPEERIATVEEFTLAIISIVRTITIRNGEEWTPFDQIKQMLIARDALIRADERQKAAERAREYLKTNNAYNGLYAAIMAEPEEATK